MADSRIERLEQQMANFGSLMERLMKKFEETSAKVDSLANKSSGDGEGSGSRNRNGRNYGGGNNSAVPKLAKLDFPRYNGMDDPTSWIYRVEQFFDYQQTEEIEKLPLAAYHLEGEVQMWYQLFKDTEEITSWEALKRGLRIRYGPTMFEDHFGSLSKLCQIGTVREYQLQFEQLLSRVGELAPTHQLGCFISGLKEPVRTDVQAARPTSITDAIGLARLFEARHGKKPLTVGAKQFESMEPTEPPLPSASLSRTKAPPIRHLSPGELQERRRKGLCFNCDENFVPGHHCKKLFLIEGIFSEEVMKDEEGVDYG